MVDVMWLLNEKDVIEVDVLRYTLKKDMLIFRGLFVKK